MVVQRMHVWWLLKRAREDHGGVVGGAGVARAGCREWARYARQAQRRRGREVVVVSASLVIIVGGILP
jgi:hypothetical protein